MTGPEHYSESERILRDAENADAGADPADVALLLQYAQVHATLALTAATAETPYREPEDGQYGIEADEQDCRTVGPF